MHVLVIHRCTNTLQQICQTLQEVGLTCECHNSPVAAAYTFAFSGVPFEAVLVDAELGKERSGGVLQVIRALQSDICIQIADTALEARQIAGELQRTTKELLPLAVAKPAAGPLV